MRSDQPSRASWRRSPRRIAALVAASVVVADQLSKAWVVHAIAPDEEIHLFGSVRLIHRTNTGIAFSVGNSSRLTAWVTTALMIALVVWVVRVVSPRRALASPSSVTPALAIALGAIAGGALGNQIDRFARGARWNRGGVVDFVDVGFWAVFNVADAALTCGCIAVAVLSLVDGRRAERDARPRP